MSLTPAQQAILDKMRGDVKTEEAKPPEQRPAPMPEDKTSEPIGVAQSTPEIE
jgi:hypothetical protein